MNTPTPTIYLLNSDVSFSHHTIIKKLSIDQITLFRNENRRRFATKKILRLQSAVTNVRFYSLAKENVLRKFQGYKFPSNFL